MKARGLKARSSLLLLHLGRPFRAWSLFIFHNPGRCPGLGLLRPFGARQQIGHQLHSRSCKITSPPSTCGRGYCREAQQVGESGEKTDFKNGGVRRNLLSGNSGGRERGRQAMELCGWRMGIPKCNLGTRGIREGRQDPITKFCQINGMGAYGPMRLMGTGGVTAGQG